MAATLDDVLAELRLVRGSILALAVALTPPAKAGESVDLDGPHGDPVVKAKSPRDWRGDDQTGKKFSQCPPEYLDQVAARLDYFAEKNEEEGTDEAKRKAKFNRLDAGRARGWAARIRAGYVAPAVQESNPWGGTAEPTEPW